MKFKPLAIATLMLVEPGLSFGTTRKDSASGRRTSTKLDMVRDRRSFISTSIISSGAAASLLFPSSASNAAYYKDGKKVDKFERPIPLYESLSPESKAKVDSYDPKLVAERKEREAKEEQERIEMERKRLEEERLRIEREPPEVPRILVLGGTGTVGKQVRSKLEEQGFFVVATSRDGRDNTIEMDVTKCYGKIEKEVQQLARENRCSAVVSLIGGVDSANDGIINGVAGQAALGASKVMTVRNFVAIGASPSITSKVPKGLENYVKAKQLSQDIVINSFKEDSAKEGMSYTILNPGAIGNSKNYGSDPSIPLETIVNAVVVGATGFYLGETSEVLEKADEIKSKASKIARVKEIKV